MGSFRKTKGGIQMKMDVKRLVELLTDLGWDYQCMTQSGKETYDEIMTMFGVLKEGEKWIEEDLL